MDQPKLPKLGRIPTYRRVYDAIEKEILAGRLRVGDMLPTEHALAEQLGVNRSTVREGVRLLEQSGFVARDGGKRPKISAPKYGDLASSAARALILHEVTFRELWAASAMIEPPIAEIAAATILPEELDALAQNIAEMEVIVKNLDQGMNDELGRFVELDREFHKVIAAATHNHVLVLAHEPVSTLFIPSGKVILSRMKTHRRVLDAHKNIFKHLKAKNTKNAREWMQRHMDDFKRGYDQTSLDLDRPISSIDWQ
ncbi:FadR/GntR family transcriptional regulator [Hyphococcus sp. DH-69]|uniref:FadR/GntR family transcriptional regulator n=1 Tax=Hyphococcus formosus TaxID=3143534 RepID=UPI00398AB113